MPLQITARHTELSDTDRELIEKRVDRFRKIAVAEQITLLDVIVTCQKNRHAVEVHVKANRFEAAGSVTHADLRTAIDRVMDRVERQLRKQLDKCVARKRHSREVQTRRGTTVTLSFATPAAPADADELERVIFHTQRISTKPMSVEEAAEQLDLDDDAFLVFNNAETDRINILYRRNDRHFGLIQPS